MVHYVKLLVSQISGEDVLIYSKDDRNMSTVTSHMLERDFKPNVTILASHEDEAYVKQLKKHLKAIPEGLINVWDDTMIIPGTQWQVEVRKALEVKVAILLVSAAFLASEFLGSNQLPSLLEAAKSGGTIILSIILLPCLFECSSLTQFKPVNSPYKPLSKMIERKYG